MPSECPCQWSWFLLVFVLSLQRIKCDRAKHQDQTESRLQGYRCALPAPRTLYSGQRTTIRGHDVTAQGSDTVCVCVCIYIPSSTPVQFCIVTFPLSVLLHLLCHGNPIRHQAYIPLHVQKLARDAAYLFCFVHNWNDDWSQIKFVFRVTTNLISSRADSSQLKPMCVRVKFVSAHLKNRRQKVHT